MPCCWARAPSSSRARAGPIRRRRQQQVECEQSNGANQPRLPHAPGESRDHGKKGERGGTIRLRLSRQQRKAQHDRRSRDRRQKRAEETKFIPALQEKIVRV